MPEAATQTRGHKKKARTRRQLVAAAIEVIAEQGPGFAVTDVAERAGVSNGTFYNYFADRDDLIDSLVADLVGGFTADSAASAVGDDPALRFASISARVLAWAATSPAMAEAILRLEIFQRPDFDEAMFGHLRADLRAGIEAGVFDGEADQATVDIVSGTLLAAAGRLTRTGPDDEYQREVLVRLLRSLGLTRAKAQSTTERAVEASAPHGPAIVDATSPFVS